MHFIEIPKDVLLLIITQLPLKDTVSLSFVSHFLKELTNNNRHWKEKLKTHFPHMFEALVNNPYDQDYKQIFIQTYREEYHGLKPRHKKLFSLVKDGDINSIIKLRLEKDDLLLQDINRIKVLDWAKKNNHQSLLDYFWELILKKTPPTRNMANKPDKDGYFLLHWAVLCNQLNFLKTLYVSMKSTKVKQGPMKFQPIHLAAQSGNLDMIEALVEAAPSTIDEQDARGQTALLWAAANGHAHVVEYLISQNADLEAVTNTIKPFNKHNGMTPLCWASKRGHLSVAKILLAYGTNFKAKSGPMQFQPIHLAAKKGQLDIVKAIVEKDPSTIDEQDMLGQTALLWAAANGHANVVDYLVSKNAALDIAANNSIGGTLLGWAIEQRLLSVVKTLLAHGANLKAKQGPMQFQPIHLAAKKGQLDIVKAIVEKDPSTIDEQDAFGQTSLLWAAANGHARVVAYLLSKNAGLDIATNEPKSMTPLCWAVKRGHLSIVKTLLAHGANSGAVLNNGTILRESRKSKKIDALLRLEKYLSKRPTEAEYKASFSILGHTFFASKCTFFGKQFNFSRDEKVLAAKQLRKCFLSEDVNYNELEKKHSGALNNGDLGKIYTKLKSM